MADNIDADIVRALMETKEEMAKRLPGYKEKINKVVDNIVNNDLAAIANAACTKHVNGELADKNAVANYVRTEAAKLKKSYNAERIRKLLDADFPAANSGQDGEQGQKQEFPIYVGDKYRVTEQGVFMKTDSKDRDYSRQICPHPFLPVRRMRDVDTYEESYQVVYYRDKAWQPLVIPAEDLLTSKGLQKYTKRGLIISEGQSRPMAEFCGAYLAADRVKEKVNVASRMGWYKNEFVPYSKNIMLKIAGSDFSQQLRSVHRKGTLEAWLAAVRPLWQSSPAFCMFMAAAAAGPIVGRLKDTTFIVELYGRTGVGKTKCLELAASMFGRPSQDGFMFVMNSTDNYFSKALNALNNMPMCIDENEIQKNARGRNLQSNPENLLLYTITSNKGRQRLKSDSRAEPVDKWSTVVLITGEQPMTKSSTAGGAKNRVVEVELERLEADFANIDDVLSANYGHMGPRIVAKIKSIENLAAELKGRRDKILAARSNISGKMAPYGAFCLLAYDILCGIMGEGALSMEDVVQYLKTEADVNNVHDVYKYITEWIVRNDRHFEKTGSGRTKNQPDDGPDRSNYNDIYGKRYDDYVTIQKSMLDKVVQEQFGKSITAYQRELGYKGYIRTRSNGKNSRSRAYVYPLMIHNVSCDCYKINLNVQYEASEGME